MSRLPAAVKGPAAYAVIGFLLLAALVWWVGPLLPFGERHPLDGTVDRLLALLLLALLFAAVWGFKAWRRRRNNRRLVKGLSAGLSGAEREAQELQQRFSQALKVLDDSARTRGRRGWLRGGQYLYELPWYVFIGLSGSGKTTALLNSGLTFPLAGKMGQAKVRGVGGTRNCEWWFTEEAVLIDTAGRYTGQDSDETTDAAAWGTFLGLLKKTRPRRPINGVMLTVNVQDLLQKTPADRKVDAAKLRTRLQELQDQLGVRPPVYVLVTKCDLLAGFNETFGELGREEREQVWGFSFPHDPRSPEAGSSPLQEFPSEFAALSKRLRDSLLARLQAEIEVPKRAAIFAFPQQFEGLKGLLGGFLEQVFEGGGELEQTALLRGVYFTSGTQEGTAIDRVLGTLARTFGVEQRPASVPSSRGKAFFLTRLLREVVFAEQGLVGENLAAEARRRRLRLGGMAAMGLAAVTLVFGWGVSYKRNSDYLAEVQARLPDAQAAVAAVPPATSAELSVLPNALDRIEATPVASAFDLDDPPLLNTLGLYQGRYIAAGAGIGYRKLLDGGLLPRVARRLEERLRAANKDNVENAYEALKGYLMLYTPEHFDALALAAWVTLDWEEQLAGRMSAEQRQSLGRHLEAAFSRGAPQALAPMDKVLVDNTREMVASYRLEDRIFNRLSRQRVGADIPEFSAASAGGPDAGKVFERKSGKPITRGIPGLFTRDGYFKVFKDSIGKVAPKLAEEERWVLGVSRPGNGIKGAATALLDRQVSELEMAVRRLYLEKFIREYDDYLDDVRLVPLSGERAIEVARLLSTAESPLVRYLRSVTRETQLGATAKELAKQATATTAAPGKVGERIESAKRNIGGVLGRAEAPPARGPVLEMMVDDHFERIHRLFRDQPPDIDETTKRFNDIYVYLTAVDAAKKSKAPPPPPPGGGGAKAAMNQQPEPIRSMLATLVTAGAAAGQDAQRQDLSAEIKPVFELCAKTIAGRFPFALGSRSDVMPDDFGQMFGHGGQLDEFFQRKLASLVDVGTTPWVYKPRPDGSKPSGGAALADFQRAAKIREAFFRSGGKVPGFKVDLRLLELDPGLREIVLDVDGQAMRFVAGNSVAQTYTWPSSRVASQIRLVMGGAQQIFEGPWALARLLSQHEVQASPQPERMTVVLSVEGKRARLEIIAASALNPLRLLEMQAFRCPASL